MDHANANSSGRPLPNSNRSRKKRARLERNGRENVGVKSSSSVVSPADPVLTTRRSRRLRLKRWTSEWNARGATLTLIPNKAHLLSFLDMRKDLAILSTVCKYWEKSVCAFVASLSVVDLQGVVLRKKWMALVGSCFGENLRVLRLGRHAKSRTGQYLLAKSFDAATSLRELDLSGSNFFSRHGGLITLERIFACFPLLEKMSLSHCDVENRHFQALCAALVHLSQNSRRAPLALKSIDLSFTSVTGRGLAGFCKFTPNLRHLCLKRRLRSSWCTQGDARTCETCGSSFPKVKCCGDCHSVFYCGKECQMYAWNRWHRTLCHGRLKELNKKEQRKLLSLTFSDILKICEHLPNLQSIDVCGNMRLFHDLTNPIRDAKRLAELCPRMERLGFSRCGAVRREGGGTINPIVGHLLGFCTNIRAIDICRPFAPHSPEKTERERESRRAVVRRASELAETHRKLHPRVALCATAVDKRRFGIGQCGCGS